LELASEPGVGALSRTSQKVLFPQEEYFWQFSEEDADILRASTNLQAFV